jgi:hypothetical protein
MFRPVRLSLVAIGTMALSANCDQLPPETTVAPAAACPAPKIGLTSWQTVTMADCGIRMKLPRGYREHRYDVVVNNAVGHSYRVGHFDSIDIDLEKVQETNTPLSQNKVIRQKDYEGYTECTERINGREAIVQSYRGGGNITDGERQFPLYSVEAVFERKPGVLVRISGASNSRQYQELILAALRAVEFLDQI